MCQITTRIDESSIDSLISLSDQLNAHHLDSSIVMAELAVKYAEQINYPMGQATAYDKLGFAMDRKGNFAKGIECYSRALTIKRQQNNYATVAWTLSEIGYCYNKLGMVDSALTYFQRGVDMARELHQDKDVALGTYRIGSFYHNRGNLQKAMNAYEEALPIGERIQDNFVTAQCLIRISNIHFQLQDYDKALDFVERGIMAATALNDKRILSSALLRKGHIKLTLKNYQEASELFKRALAMSEEIEHEPGILSALIAIGDVHIQLHEYPKALDHYQRAYEYAVDMKAISDESQSSYKIGDAYFRMNQFGKAISQGKRSFELAKTQEDPYLQKNAAELLWKSYREIHDYENALTYHEVLKQISDSTSIGDFEKSMLEKEMLFKQTTDSLRFAKEQEFLRAEQEKKDTRQRNIRNATAAGLVGALIFLLVVYRQRNKISKARKLSDELLLNILPGEVADELKMKGSAAAKHFDQVTVMFTDFKGFTQISEKLSPAQLVAEIDTCFKAFDNIISKYNIEKIKTIGDAYMCSGGLPVANHTHAEDTLRAAIDIQRFMADHTEQRKRENKPVFEIRIGIHTGPVVAGIVGVKKFAYDIWGDTVNIAARMEQNSEAGKINVSAATYELVRHKFNFLHRGKISAKNKGEIDMYFLESTSVL